MIIDSFIHNHKNSFYISHWTTVTTTFPSSLPNTPPAPPEPAPHFSRRNVLTKVQYFHSTHKATAKNIRLSCDTLNVGWQKRASLQELDLKHIISSLIRLLQLHPLLIIYWITTENVFRWSPPHLFLCRKIYNFRVRCITEPW